MDPHLEMVFLFPWYLIQHQMTFVSPPYASQSTKDFLCETHVVSSKNNLFHFAMLSFVYYGMLQKLLINYYNCAHYSCSVKN